jgi:cobalt-zinc-cadmium efflux system outer membrane protein
MRISKAGAWFACLLCGLAGFRVAAADGTGLTLAQAIDNALRRNPELRASAFRITRAEAQIAQAGLRPVPELALDLENFAGSGDTSGTNALESTLSFTQVLELGGKRDTRVAIAQAAGDLALIEQRARELDILAEVTRRFLAAAAAAEQLRLAHDTELLAAETLNAVSRRVAAARSPLADESRARIAHLRASLDVQQADSLWRSRKYALASSWGDAEPQFTTLRADLFAFENDAGFGALLARAERNPDLLRFANETRLHDAEMRLAQSQSRPDLALTLGLRHLRESNDMALVAGVAMPLNSPRRTEAALRIARAELARSQAEQDAAAMRVRSTLFGLHEEMNSARRQAEALRSQALPLARTALEQTQAGYDRGRFAFTELASARHELLALQSAAIESAATYHELRTEIQRLTGEPLKNPEAHTP